MRSTTLIISFCITIFLIVMFKDGHFGANDAFLWVNSSSQDISVLTSPFRNKDKDIIHEKVAPSFDAIIITDVEENGYLEILKNNEYDNIIIFTENSFNLGRSNFSFKEEFDLDIHSSQVNDFVFFNNKNDNLIRELIDQDYENNIVSVSLKTFLGNKDLNYFYDEFFPNLEGKNLLITISEFPEIENKIVSSFHSDYSKTVLSLLDTDSLDYTSIKNKAIIRAFFVFCNLLELEIKDFSDSYLYFSKDGLDHFEPVYILAFGDMMLGRYVRTLMDRHGHDYIFEKIRGENNVFFQVADFIFANLEGPIKGDGFKSSHSMVFGFPEYVAPLLKKYRFNILMIANNHSLDQGNVGRDTTISALEDVGIGWCGNPRFADKESVYYKEVRGKKIAFICFQDVSIRLNREEARNLVGDVSKNVDFTIVSAHYGVEYKHKASESLQVIPSREWIDNGADIVIGHHPHVVQNFEIYNGKIIFYSLGNFVFDQYWSSATQEQLGIGIVLEKDFTRVYLIPMKSERSQARLMTEKEYNDWIERFISYGNYSDELKDQIRRGLIEVSR